MPSKRETKNQEVQEARTRLRGHIAPGRLIYTQTSFTRSETDYVRVFVVANGEIREVTADVGKITDYRFVNNDSRYGLALKGGGYSKGLDVVLSLYRRFDLKLDQADWREL